MFQNWKLGTKLLASFIFLSLLASSASIIGLIFISNINNTLNEITDIAAPTVETTDDLARRPSTRSSGVSVICCRRWRSTSG